MPRVGTTHYGYDAAGKKAAAGAAKRTGQPVINTQPPAAKVPRPKSPGAGGGVGGNNAKKKR